MNSLMSYDGYHAKIAYDADDNIFVGNVIGIQDDLYFHGKTVDELKHAFHACIENYKSFCRETGEETQKEYKRSFNVRITPEAYRKAALEATNEGISINQFVSNAIEMTITIMDDFTDPKQLSQRKRMRGVLSSYADPTLQKKEESALERALVKKCGNT